MCNFCPIVKLQLHSRLSHHQFVFFCAKVFIASEYNFKRTRTHHNKRVMLIMGCECNVMSHSSTDYNWYINALISQLQNLLFTRSVISTCAGSIWFTWDWIFAFRVAGDNFQDMEGFFALVSCLLLQLIHLWKLSHIAGLEVQVDFDIIGENEKRLWTC